jgi:RNA polymerase sigma factor (sigma-70 family)
MRIERDLIVAAKQRGSAARQQVTESFMPLVGAMAKIYSGSRAVDRVELLQEGVVGLLRAVDRFDPELGTPFWAYASWWVRQSMQQLVGELARPVVLSDRAVRQLARVKDAELDFQRDHGKDATTRDLADATGLETRQVDNLIAAARRPRGLQEPVQAGNDSMGTFADLLADPTSQDAFERVPRRIAASQVPRMLGALDERERTIVRARYGLDGDGEQTLGQIGTRLGVSAERVRQIEERALDKLLDVAVATGV